MSKMNIGNVPPNLNRLVSGDHLVNTEHEKNSKILRLKSATINGSQKVMLELLTDKQVDLANLPDSDDLLKNLCQKLEMKDISR